MAPYEETTMDVMRRLSEAVGVLDSSPEEQALARAMVAHAISMERFWELQDVLREAFEQHGRKFSDWNDRHNRAWVWIEQWAAHRWPRPDPGSACTSVAIVGMAHEWRLAPWGRPGWELWGLNDAYTQLVGRPPIEAFTRWFQVHNPQYMAKHYRRGLDSMKAEWTRRTGVTLYMDRAYDEYPDSKPLPREAIAALTARGWYHCSSFDWMVALALHEGFKKIALYGCDFYTPPVMNSEPLSARPCLEYWIGVCEGRGVEVEVHSTGGHLFKNLHLALRTSTLQYGFDREPGLDLSKEDHAWMDVR